MASPEKTEDVGKYPPTTMFQGKNIHSSPVDGKLLCSFSEKTCMQRRLNHYAFCIRHVLEDKNAPFKQCKFVAKYNGQRCTNAIPVKEERVYCNSHLQVLGIVPKKIRKKKIQDETESNAKDLAKTSSAGILTQSRMPEDGCSKQTERAACPAEPSKSLYDESNSRKAKILSSNPLLWQLVSTYSQADSYKPDLFRYYGLCSSDEDSLYEEESEGDCKLELDQLKNITTCVESRNAKGTRCTSRAGRLQQLRESLCTQLLGVKNSINTFKKNGKQSAKALDLLLTSAKASPALTTVVIANSKNSSLSSSRKRSAPNQPDPMQCTASNREKTRCKDRALPYTKYCFDHIVNDNKQVLFQECVADISINSRCSAPVLDLLYDKPLCGDHAVEKQVVYDPVTAPVRETGRDMPLTCQKVPIKKPRRKPQVRASPTHKPVRPSKKVSRKEVQKMMKSEKNKKVVNFVSASGNVKYVNVQQEVCLDHSENHLNVGKSPECTSTNLVTQQEPGVCISNGGLKMESSPKNNIFGNELRKTGMFDDHDINVDEGLGNEDLNIPEDLGDISPTGVLRDTVIEIPEPKGGSHLMQHPRKSPIESYAINAESDGIPQKPSVLGNRGNTPRKEELEASAKQQQVHQVRVNHLDAYAGVRPLRSSVITLPKFNSAALGSGLARQNVPSTSAEFAAFSSIGTNSAKTENGIKKLENRVVELNHGPTLFPLSLDTVFNPSISWTSGGKHMLNNRSRPLLQNSQMNPATFSPPSLSPHMSPQTPFGTSFNFDRPTVLQHSNSPSPTLSPFSPNVPNSPHGKLAPRTIRLETRGNQGTSNVDPFFAASFEKP